MKNFKLYILVYLFCYCQYSKSQTYYITTNNIHKLIKTAEKATKDRHTKYFRLIDKKIRQYRKKNISSQFLSSINNSDTIYIIKCMDLMGMDQHEFVITSNYQYLIHYILDNDYIRTIKDEYTYFKDGLYSHNMMNDRTTYEMLVGKLLNTDNLKTNLLRIDCYRILKLSYGYELNINSFYCDSLFFP